MNHDNANHLRGAAAAATHRWLTTTTTEDEFSNDVSDMMVDLSTSNKGKGTDVSAIYLILLSVMMGFICLFYAGCLFAILHTWIWHRCFGARVDQDDNDGDDEGNEAAIAAAAADTVVVHEGRVFNVVGNQRRAVLEAIFKETSKLAAEVDVLKKRKKKRKTTSEDDDAKVPQNVEIPTMIESLGADNNSNNNLASPARTSTTTGSSSLSEGQDDDQESAMGRSDVPLCPFSETHLQIVDHDDLTIQSDDFQPTDGIVQERNRQDEASTRYNHLHNVNEVIDQTPWTSLDIGFHEESFDGPANNLTPVHVNMDRKSDAGLSSISTFTENEEERKRLPDTIAMPTLADTRTTATMDGPAISERESIEESKEEVATTETNPSEKTEQASSFDHGIASRQSITTVASEYTYDDDDSTVTSGDIVCPICLCGYKKGDTLIVAKHCTHMYHKDCIFDWLDKHTDCPVCRKDMITASEKVAMHRATSLRSSTPSYGYRRSLYR